MRAFLFPGQGSQAVGMGKEWSENSPLAREMYQRADKALGKTLSAICFNGPDEVLTDTRNAQPAIYTASCVAADLLRERGIAPDYVAGHSIGEYAALYCAGCFDFETGLQLVSKRAQCMADAAAASKGTMAAVIRMEPVEVTEIVAAIAAEGGGALSVAGYNSPEQTVISGAVALVETAIEKLKASGARRVMPLPVSGAFHSELMRPAQESFAAAVAEVAMKAPEVPFISNNTANQETEPDAIREQLPRQLTSSVRWTETMAFLKQAGCDKFIESGPGTVLAGLLRKFDAGLSCVTLTTVASFDTAKDDL